MEEVHYGEQLSWSLMEEVYTQILTGIVETMTELDKELTLGTLGADDNFYYRQKSVKFISMFP